MDLSGIFSTKIKLPAADVAELARCKEIIAAHVRDYPKVGQALATIQKRQLYRSTHETFETFIHDHWRMDKAHAYRLIAAAEVAGNLSSSPAGDFPATERQARPLTVLSPPDQLAAWDEAKQLAGGADRVTTLHVAQAAATRSPKKKKARPVKPTRLRVPGGIVILQPGRGFTSAEAMLTEALEKLAGQAAKKAA